MGSTYTSLLLAEVGGRPYRLLFTFPRFGGSRIVVKKVPSVWTNSQLKSGPLARLGDPWKEERYTGD